MPSLSALISQLQAYVLGGPAAGSSTTKKWVTALAVLLTMLWLYKRVENARAAERLRAARAGVNGGRPLPGALRQVGGPGAHMPSPLPASHQEVADANDVRNLNPAERYLSERGSRVRRQAVCIALNATNGVVFELPGADGSSSVNLSGALKVQDAVAPLLCGLAQHSLLYLVVVEADKARQEALMAALEAIGLLDNSGSSSGSSSSTGGGGLKKHRVLFCSTAKGKGSIVRHLEPNLFVDDDRATLATLKPHLDQVVHVQAPGAATTAASAAASSAAEASIPSFPSLVHYFLPKQAAASS